MSMLLTLLFTCLAFFGLCELAEKISAYTLLREILYTDSQDILVKLSTVASRY
jgi:hypothetical protein